MKKYLAALAVLVIFAVSGVAMAASPEPRPHKHLPASCTVQGLRPFSAKVWDPQNWERGMPKQSVIDAYRKRLRCAPDPHRKAMKKVWRSDKQAYFERRAKELFRIRITPFPCDGRWWATPCEIPLHESGYGSGGGNLYGLLDAWGVQGCYEFAGSAWDATKKQQDICAHRHYMDYGRGGWPAY